MRSVLQSVVIAVIAEAIAVVAEVIAVIAEVIAIYLISNIPVA